MPDVGRTSIKYQASSIRKIDAIAVTVGPGLVGSLLVGKMTAEALGWAWNVPVVGVNHLEGHIFSALLEHKEIAPPFIGLVVSGGHTDIVVVRDFGRYDVLGRTRDDSAGESFDKVANILDLGYPGGPLIDKIARTGNNRAVPFKRPFLEGTWDFSFSGIKTAVLYHVRGQNCNYNRSYGKVPPQRSCKLDPKQVADICASFQTAVVDVLVDKTILAAKTFRLKNVAVGGGVSSNTELRARFMAEGKKNGINVYFPSRNLSTDNAAMIAAAGYFKLRVMKQSPARPPRRTAASGGRLPYGGAKAWRAAGQRKYGGEHAGLNVDPSLEIQNWGTDSGG